MKNVLATPTQKQLQAGNPRHQRPMRDLTEGSRSAAYARGTTRFDAFWLQQRGRPLRFILNVFGLMMIGVAYGYLMLYLPPDRSYEYVSTWKMALEYRTREIMAEKAEIKRIREAEHEKGSEQASDYLSEPARLLTYVLGYLFCRNVLRTIRSSRRSLRESLPVMFLSRRMPRVDQANSDIESERQHLERPNVAEDLYSFQVADDQERTRNVDNSIARGATRRQISACPVRVVQAGGEDEQTTQCDICLLNYQAGDLIRTIPCFHSFHANCIDDWLMQRGTCPVCMHPI